MRRERTILAIVATDATYEKKTTRGETLWVGRCIFCSRALSIGEDGSPRSAATIEHIVPRSHGGDDALTNLALACKGCNNEKGMRHDVRRRGDPRLGAIIAALQDKRRARWRSPDEVGLGHLVRDPTGSPSR